MNRSHDGHLINITQKSYNQLLLPLTLEEITDHYQLDKVIYNNINYVL